MSDKAISIPDSPTRWEWRFIWTSLACLVLLLAGVAAYSDSFNGPFILDDTICVYLPSATHLWPIRPILAAPRPVVQFTLALNHAFGGGVRGYHFFNLAIHLLAGLTLFGVMRRTLTMPRLDGRFSQETANALAFCTALLWMLHPLQTEAVTYVIQRMESLMGLFYLLALYCLIRSASSRRPVGWTVASVICCALGMGCKEVMVTAPVMLLLYDRIFITGSFLETLRRRWFLYLALLAAGCVFLAGSVAQAFARSPLSAGFRLASVTPIEYARSQLGVILHYLALAFYPSGLCLDYNWPVAQSLSDIAPGAIVIGLLLAATILALARRPMWGFAGVWFFLILAPTSSFLPIRDLAFEHRMYLSLAALAAVVVVAIYLLAERLARRLNEAEAESAFSAELIVLVLTISVAAVLGALTWHRNAQYQTGIEIWQDTVNKRPGNPRGWNNLADALINVGDYTRVLHCCDEAIRMRSNFPEPYNNRGLWYANQGQYEEAVKNYTQAIQLRENFPLAYNNRASACIHLKRYAQAIQDCRRAIELDPQMAMAYYNLGNACAKTDDNAGAAEAFTKAIELRWTYAETYYDLGRALQRLGRRDEALANYDKAISLSLDYYEAYFERANLRAAAHLLSDAIQDFDIVIRLKPDDAEAYNGRGNARLSAGEYALAISDFDKALALKPGQPETCKSRAEAHYHLKAYDEAWADVQACEKLGGRPEPEFIRSLSRDSGRSR
jgi:tetratricopeptide (TPR) repeat protein